MSHRAHHPVVFNEQTNTEGIYRLLEESLNDQDEKKKQSIHKEIQQIVTYEKLQSEYLFCLK